MIRRTNQGGSIASFVVIGVILVAGLLSAIYFVNQRGQQARKDQTIAANNKTQTPKPETTNTTSIKSTTNTSTTKAPNNSTTKSQSSNLPATGVETPISSLVSVFILSTSVVGYVMSRRALEHSL